MRFQFVLVGIPLFALADANAQTSSQSPVRECDEQCVVEILRQDLQRRADELRKELVRCIADEVRSGIDKELAHERCADRTGARLYKDRNSN
jgi:predicted phage gp36 major capsid-like protein